jgi:thiamine kinase-like enzyme
MSSFLFLEKFDMICRLISFKINVKINEKCFEFQGEKMKQHENKALIGGRLGKIHKIDNKVVRPANKWTKTVHEFLNFINEKGADFVPIPYGVKNGMEIVSFLEGQVYHEPLPEIFGEESMIISAAELLAKFHGYSAQYLPSITEKCTWMLPSKQPTEIICHGDFAPYNTVIVNHKASAIIDFDTLHPGSKLWDVAYAVYRWVPFVNEAEENFGENMKKVRLFLDAYGLDKKSRAYLIPVLIERLQSLMAFMQSEAELGNIDFQKNIEAGHMRKYRDDIAYLKKNEKRLTKCFGIA